MVACDMEYSFKDYIEKYKDFKRDYQKINMRIIITGACGHIGSFVSNKIHKIKKLKELILIDNFSSQKDISLFLIFVIKSKQNFMKLMLVKKIL